MSTVTRRGGVQMLDGETMFLTVVAGVLFLAVGVFVCSAQLGAKLAGWHRRKVPVDPIKLIEALHSHRLTWPPYANRRRRGEHLADRRLRRARLAGFHPRYRAYRSLGTVHGSWPVDRTVDRRCHLSEVQVIRPAVTGLLIATAACGGTKLYMDFESCCLDIWGMRAGRRRRELCRRSWLRPARCSRHQTSATSSI